MEFKQASDVYINVKPVIDGSPLTLVSKAKYVVFQRDKVILLEKTLNNGISFSAEEGLTVHLTDVDTLTLGPGRYEHEMVVQDLEENDTFVLKGNFKIVETVARI